MKVYAFIGDSRQTIVPDNFNYQPQESEVLMVSERPQGSYIAKADGTWQEYTPVLVPTNEERLTALEADTEAMNDMLLGLVEIVEIMDAM